MVKVTDCNKIISSNGNKMKKDIPGARDAMRLEYLAAAATVAMVVDLSRLVMVVVVSLSRGGVGGHVDDGDSDGGGLVDGGDRGGDGKWWVMERGG